MLTRRFGDFDTAEDDTAEDDVREALLAAATQWPAEGVRGVISEIGAPVRSGVHP